MQVLEWRQRCLLLKEKHWSCKLMQRSHSHFLYLRILLLAEWADCTFASQHWIILGHSTCCCRNFELRLSAWLTYFLLQLEFCLESISPQSQSSVDRELVLHSWESRPATRTCQLPWLTDQLKEFTNVSKWPSTTINVKLQCLMPSPRALCRSTVSLQR